MKTAICYILSFLLLLSPASTIKTTAYTIYIPEEPTSVIIYYNCGHQLYHITDKEPRYPYSFQEGIADIIFENNPHSIIVVTHQQNKQLTTKIDELIEQYQIKDIIISGWSAGGNHAIKTATALAADDRDIQLLLIDCNHTDNLQEKEFQILKEYNIPIHYTSNVMGAAKNKKLRNIIKAELPITFYQLSIPEDYSGSNHMYCRDCAVSYDLYGYILGTAPLNENYKLGYFNYTTHENIF